MAAAQTKGHEETYRDASSLFSLLVYRIYEVSIF